MSGIWSWNRSIATPSGTDHVGPPGATYLIFTGSPAGPEPSVLFSCAPQPTSKNTRVKSRKSDAIPNLRCEDRFSKVIVVPPCTKSRGRHKAEALRGDVSDYFGAAGLEDLASRSGRLALLEVASCAGGTAAAWLGVWACVGKSTYARCGIIVNVTPFEPSGKDTSRWRSATPPPAGPHLRRRRHCPGAVFRRRSAGSLLRRPQRQVSETDRHHPAPLVKKRVKRSKE